MVQRGPMGAGAGMRAPAAASNPAQLAQLAGLTSAVQSMAPIVSLDPEEVQLHLIVPDSMAGVILGRGGSRIKETMTTANCRLRMTNRVKGSDEPRRFIIVGPIDSVCIAQQLLNEQLREAYGAAGHPEPVAFAIIMLIRKEACGAVIGKGGSVIS